MSYHINEVSFCPTLTLSVPGRWCFFNPLPFEKWDIYHQSLALFGKKLYKMKYSLFCKNSEKLPQNYWY